MPSVEGHEPRNTAADSSRCASTPHDAHARTPHPDASMLDVRPPSRPLHLQIEGENRSWLRGSKQACEKWTLTFSLISQFCFPVRAKNFPDNLCREITRKS